MFELDFDWLNAEQPEPYRFSVLRFDFDWLGMEYSSQHDCIHRTVKYLGMV